jgi:glycine/D-amino acid oxidase-like deaminating enzyme
MLASRTAHVAQRARALSALIERSAAIHMAAGKVVVAAGSAVPRLLAGIVDLPMLSERGY